MRGSNKKVEKRRERGKTVKLKSFINIPTKLRDGQAAVTIKKKEEKVNTTQ